MTVPAEQGLWQNRIAWLRQRVREYPGDHEAASDLAAFLGQAWETNEASPSSKTAPTGRCPTGHEHNLAELYRNTGTVLRAEALFDGLLAH
jgi:hypothetical protein